MARLEDLWLRGVRRCGLKAKLFILSGVTTCITDVPGPGVQISPGCTLLPSWQHTAVHYQEAWPVTVGLAWGGADGRRAGTTLKLIILQQVAGSPTPKFIVRATGVISAGPRVNRSVAPARQVHLVLEE